MEKIGNLGIPIKLLHEATGFQITVELHSGDSYRGTLTMIEDNMNCWLHGVVHTAPNGEKVKSDSTYLRGSNILLVTLPDALSNAKLFITGESTAAGLKRQGKVKRTFTSVKIRKQAH